MLKLNKHPSSNTRTNSLQHHSKKTKSKLNTIKRKSFKQSLSPRSLCTTTIKPISPIHITATRTMQSTLNDPPITEQTVPLQSNNNNNNNNNNNTNVYSSYSPIVLNTILEPIYHAYSNNPESSQRAMRILDLGCGTGIFTKALALELYKVSEGVCAEIYTVDIDPKPLNVFKKDLSIAGFRLPSSPIAHDIKDYSDPAVQAIVDLIKVPYVASVDELPYKNNFFDGIIAAQSFHCFSTPQALINIQRCLTPNGIFAFCWNDWISAQQSSTPNQDDQSLNNIIPTQDKWTYQIAAAMESLYVETKIPYQKHTAFQKLFSQNAEVYEKRFGLSAPFTQLHSVFLDTRPETTRWANRELVHKTIDHISSSSVQTLPEGHHFIHIINSILDHPDTPQRVNELTNEIEWPIGFWSEVHYAQNSKCHGTPLGDHSTSF